MGFLPEEVVLPPKWREGKAFLVARRRGEFTPPKPGGRRMSVKHFPDFRGAPSASWQYFYKYKLILFSASVR